MSCLKRTDEAMDCLICFYIQRRELSTGLCGFSSRSLIGGCTKHPMSTRTAETKATVTADETLVESLQEPIRVFLGDRAIVQGLLNAVTEGRFACSLDRVLYILNIHARLISDL